jgi:hypothetical protein
MPGDGLKIDMPPADALVVEHHVGAAVAADDGEWLRQGSRSSGPRALDDDP